LSLEPRLCICAIDDHERAHHENAFGRPARAVIREIAAGEALQACFTLPFVGTVR
jgi:hypothetical protein